MRVIIMAVVLSISASTLSADLVPAAKFFDPASSYFFPASGAFPISSESYPTQPTGDGTPYWSSDVTVICGSITVTFDHANYLATISDGTTTLTHIYNHFIQTLTVLGGYTIWFGTIYDDAPSLFLTPVIAFGFAGDDTIYGSSGNDFLLCALP